MKKTILEGTPKELSEYEELLAEVTPLARAPNLTVMDVEDEEEEDYGEWEWLKGPKGGKIFNIEREPYYLYNTGYFQHIGEVNNWDYVQRVLEAFRRDNVPEIAWNETQHLVEDMITNSDL